VDVVEAVAGDAILLDDFDAFGRLQLDFILAGENP
jgi:hypothetical protein